MLFLLLRGLFSRTHLNIKQLSHEHLENEHFLMMHPCQHSVLDSSTHCKALEVFLLPTRLPQKDPQRGALFDRCGALDRGHVELQKLRSQHGSGGQTGLQKGPWIYWSKKMDVMQCGRSSAVRWYLLEDPLLRLDELHWTLPAQWGLERPWQWMPCKPVTE